MAPSSPDVTAPPQLVFIPITALPEPIGPPPLRRRRRGLLHVGGLAVVALTVAVLARPGAPPRVVSPRAPVAAPARLFDVLRTTPPVVRHEARSKTSRVKRQPPKRRTARHRRPVA